MYSNVKKKLICISATILLQVGCGDNTDKMITPEMQQQARKSVTKHLESKGLPIENLNEFNSKAHPKPDFGFLYTGDGRCIELIVYCYGSTCTEVRSYPFDKHDDQCPTKPINADSLSK